jgi:ssDNA-binding Zn-finger/Zn-ribbon topoisomerase 1
MDEELKPCPFCGGESRMTRPRNGGEYFVQCVGIGCCYGKHDVQREGYTYEADAVAFWNRRLAPAPAEPAHSFELQHRLDRCGEHVGQLQEQNEALEGKLTKFNGWLIKAQTQVRKLEEENAALKFEVETLRRYGNKDCTAMADAALEEEARA